MSPIEPYGPDYNVDSAALRKFRSKAKRGGGLQSLTRAERVAYADAVEAAVLASQKSFLCTAGKSTPRPICASGTWHVTGEAISAAVREQQRRALLSCPSQIRRARKPDEWRSMYADAMRAKNHAAT